MLTRSTRSQVTFSNAFSLGDGQCDLPAGTYEIVVEEDLLQGISFEAYRRTATYLIVVGRGNTFGQTTMHMTTKEELEHLVACDRTLSETIQNSEAALSPLEDMT